MCRNHGLLRRPVQGRVSWAAAAALAWAGLVPAVGWADEAKVPVDEAAPLDGVRFVVGAVVNNSPIYWGQTERSTGAHPMFALRWGKLRLSNSSAGGLIGEANASSASTDLVSGDGWRVRAGLRIDRGRTIKGDSEGRLSDLPKVRGTLRGRLAVTHSWGDNASLTAFIQPDLLGREGGTVAQLGYYQRLPAPELLQGLGGTWSWSANVAGGDRTYMRSYFGVPEGAQRFSAYQPGAGLRSAAVGLGWQREMGERQQWVLFSGLNAQRLLGPAADAPFVQERSSWAVSVGLAYRR